MRELLWMEEDERETEDTRDDGEWREVSFAPTS